MTRALSPVLGTVLLLAITVALAGTVGLVVFEDAAAEPSPRTTFSLSADAAADRIVLTHEGGDTLSTTDLTIRVAVDGDPIHHQPPVPFFAASGFHGGPIGPFNPATDPEWSAGEDAGFELASTNAPLLDPGDAVEVTISSEGSVIARLETTAT
ncbi:type IV pilin [Halapricum salinum]|uniref:Type IV pilin n=1 Tax=Halapricum salinum TaxID=1457250 RepID=A0A4D6HBZ3_9EURY|nr:type IV pilin N-terminal domain-containing protein [Halapricum salinum]QCC51513.1 type IV pilin [Halapricum salinum]